MGRGIDTVSKRGSAYAVRFRSAILGLLMCGVAPVCAQPEPDFSLPDVNPGSPRYNAPVTPRDYILQVSGYYFGAASLS